MVTRCSAKWTARDLATSQEKTQKFSKAQVPSGVKCLWSKSRTGLRYVELVQAERGVAKAEISVQVIVSGGSTEQSKEAVALVRERKKESGE